MRRLLLPLVVLLALVASACGGSEPTRRAGAPGSRSLLAASKTNAARSSYKDRAVQRATSLRLRGTVERTMSGRARSRSAKAI